MKFHIQDTTKGAAADDHKKHIYPFPRTRVILNTHKILLFLRIYAAKKTL